MSHSFVINLQKLRGIGTVLFIDDQGRFNTELGRASPDTVEEDHVGSLVNAGIYKAHPLGLQASGAKRCNELRQPQGSVHEVKVSARPEESGGDARNVIEGAEQFVTGNRPGVQPLQRVFELRICRLCCLCSFFSLAFPVTAFAVFPGCGSVPACSLLL